MQDTQVELQQVAFSKSVSNYYPEILTEEALAFIAGLHEKFNDERLSILKVRTEQQKVFDANNFPKFPNETKSIREGEWKARGIPHDL
ncbi:MAG: malate synthase, partial [Spirosomataceae bacterium]